MICYWCYWGWPKPIREIYDDAVAKLGCDAALLYGPAHVVWADENWDSAAWCIEHFNEYAEDLSEREKEIVRESLVKLLAVPDEYKSEPENYDGENPANYPPPGNWEYQRR